MNNKYLKAIGAIATVVSLFSCQREEDYITGRTHTFTATIENSTKTIFEQKDNSCDLITKWQGHEYVKVFLDNGSDYKGGVDPIKVSEVFDDGHSARFSYKVPYEWGESASYDVKIFTTTCNPVISNKKIYFNASLIRESMATFMVPVYSETTVESEGELNAGFHHYYAYEVLHITNTSSAPVQFSLMGFEADNVWYKSKGSLCLDDGQFVVDAPSTRDPITESTTITIGPIESGVIVSAYIPNGQNIQDATMVAKVNGQVVKSSNKKSSDAEIKQGHAYHMYATWDGNELSFDESGIVMLEAEPSPLIFGEVPVGTSSVKDLVIKNSGTISTRVYVQGKEPGNAFSYPEVDSSLGPGEEVSIPVTFVPFDIATFGTIMRIGTSPDNLWDGIQVNLQGEGVDSTSFVIPDAVDLGLSVMWASCNIGASSPEEYGDFFAWGEVETKQYYTNLKYKWYDDSIKGLTKYNYDASYGYVDNKTVLDPEDDVAHVLMGGDWRMPTDGEWAELRDNCTWTLTELNGVRGRLVTSNKNGESIFLPAAGQWRAGVHYDAGYYGYYMSSSLDLEDPSRVWGSCFDSWIFGRSYMSRSSGQSVRPITE